MNKFFTELSNSIKDINQFTKKYIKSTKYTVVVEQSTIKGVRKNKEVTIQISPIDNCIAIGSLEFEVLDTNIISEADSAKFSFTKFAIGSAVTGGLGGLVLGKNGKKVSGKTHVYLQTSAGVLQISTTDMAVAQLLAMTTNKTGGRK